MTNGSEVSSQPSQTEFSPAKILKQVFAAAIVCALWAVILWQSQLVVSSISYVNWALPAAGLVLFMRFLALTAMILENRLYFILIAVLAFAYLLFFPINLYAVLAIACLLFGFWRAYFRVKFEMANHIKFGAHQIIRRASSMFMLAFLLVVSFNVLANVSEDLANDDSRIYSGLADMVTRGVLPIVERNLPGFHRALTLDQYIVNGFVNSIPQYQDLPPEVREGELAQSREQLLAYLHIQAVGSEPLTDIARRAVEIKLAEVLRPHAAFLPLIYGLVIFSLLRILAFFVEWLSLAFGALLFWILRKTEFLKITHTQIFAEHVEI